MQNTKQPNTKQDKKTIHRVHCAVTDTTPTQSHNQIHTDTSCTPQIDVSVVDSGGETPGPIPNPEAKPARADGTAPGRRWESRLPPTQQLHTNTRHTPTLMVRGGCSIYPAPSTHYARASRKLHGGHCRHLHTPQRRLSGVQGSSAPLLQHRYLLADTATPHCRHRRHLDTPQPGLVGRQGWHGLIADFATALRTPQAPRHSGMQTWFAVGKGLSFCCGLRHRIADSWIALDYRHSNSAIRLALTIADFASLHCGQCRYLHTPRRG